MRRLIALLLIAAFALVPAACRKQPQGEIKVVVIGKPAGLKDPAAGPLTTSDQVLLQNVAQGLVSFDAAGNIVAGLAERWNVSDDGMSYIFRIAAAKWPDGSKITAQQVARILKRQLGPRSRNPMKDTLGAVSDIVPMTDRVIEIRLLAPRPNLLPLLAQPEFAIVRGGVGTGPFRATPEKEGELRLQRDLMSSDEEVTRTDTLLLSTAPARDAVVQFARGDADLVLGGTFADLPYARRIKLPRGSLRYDPASGLFGLMPTTDRGGLDDPELRQILSAAFDRDGFVSALGVPGLAPRATLLEPGLDGMANPVSPSFAGVPLAERLPALRSSVTRMLGNEAKPRIRVALPEGPGADLLLQFLQRDWGTLGFTVERAKSPAAADFVLIDEVAPSSSAAWFGRRFHCGAATVCKQDVDELLDAARTSSVPGQRYALLGQAAQKIDELQLFIPITAPVRWSLVSKRIQAFAGNRYARHSLVDLEQKDEGD